MLFHRRHVPQPPLSQYIENLWLVRGKLPTRWRNMIFPDGAMEMIFNLGDPQKLCDRANPGKHTIFKRSWVSGERVEPIVVEEAGAINLVGVRFRPGGAYPFFRFPISELTGQVVELDAVLGSAISRLREKLADVSNPGHVFARLEQWLQQQLVLQTPSSRPVAFALAQIRLGGEDARIARIVEMTGISHKHLVREFDRWVGLSPKMLARVCAFQASIAWIGFKPKVDWADAAADCGYCDQAHFIHEFRAFTGLTPAAYLAKRGPFLNYVTIE